MSFTCYIVDDEQHAIDRLSMLIRKVPILQLVGFESDPLSAVNKITSGVVAPDILFLDVDMPGIMGTEMAQLLGDRSVKVFVTAYKEYAFDAFQSDAVDYLLKPINEADFKKTLNKITKTLAARNPMTVRQKQEEFILLKLDSRNYKKVLLENIISIEAGNTHMIFKIKSEKAIAVLTTMANLEAELPKEMFIRVHKSYMVNLRYISGIVGNRVLLEDESAVDVSATYKEALFARFKKI